VRCMSKAFVFLWNSLCGSRDERALCRRYSMMPTTVYISMMYHSSLRLTGQLTGQGTPGR
jgi:hypothetical protein